MGINLFFVNNTTGHPSGDFVASPRSDVEDEDLEVVLPKPFAKLGHEALIDWQIQSLSVSPNRDVHDISKALQAFCRVWDQGSK